MFGFGILSGLTFLPLVGVALHPDRCAATDEATLRNARWVALLTTLVDLRAVARRLGAVRPVERGFQFVEQQAWFGARHQLQAWASTASRCSSCC